MTKEKPRKCCVVQKQLDLIEKRLPSLVNRKSVSETSKTTLKAHVIRASLLHRCHELAETSLYLSKRSAIVPALVVARAAFETATLLFYTYEQIDTAMTNKDFSKIDEVLMRIMFGERRQQIANGGNISAINILTVVDRLDKETASLGVDAGSIRGIYDDLCEYAHPNFSGTFGAYAEVDEQDHFYVAFGTKRMCLEPDMVLPPLELSLLILEEYDNKLAKILPEFTKLHESNRNQEANDHHKPNDG